jgi:hypothetical protein
LPPASFQRGKIGLKKGGIPSSGKSTTQAQPVRQLANGPGDLVPAFHGARHDSELAGGAVGFRVDVADELGAGEDGQRVVTPLALGRRGVDFPVVVELPQRPGDRPVVDEGIKRREKQRVPRCS